MLIRTSPSSFGTAYFTHDATSTGDPAEVDWVDFWRMKKTHTPKYGDDGTPFVATVGTGAKGPITLVIPSCPQALWTALDSPLNGTSHSTLTLKHPQLGTKAYEAQLISRIAGQDWQLESGDPALDVTLRFVAFRLAS